MDPSERYVKKNILACAVGGYISLPIQLAWVRVGVTRLETTPLNYFSRTKPKEVS